jgi:hypothetical protein
MQKRLMNAAFAITFTAPRAYQIDLGARNFAGTAMALNALLTSVALATLVSTFA